MVLQTRLINSVNGAKLQFFNGEPPWANGNINNIWSLQTGGDYGVSQVTNGDSTTIYIQYGDNVIGWASIRFYSYTLTKVSEQVNNDNSINVEYKIIGNFWKSRRLSSFTGYRVQYDINIDTLDLWNHTGLTTDVINKSSTSESILKLTLAPKTTSNASSLKIQVWYPDKQFPDNTTFLGLELYNPLENDPKLKPYAIRKNGVFKTLNRGSGFFKIRKGSTWNDKHDLKKSEIGQENKSQNRIRKNGKWLAQNKIGAD